jgi:hypothetical protein
MKHSLLSLALCASLVTSTAAHAHPPNASDASALSMLPIAISVAAPVMLLSAGAMLTVVAVEASAAGTVCILERASDGARASVTLSAHGAGALSVGVGTVVTVSAFSAGWVLSSAGRAIAYIPNEIGAALLHNERVTR